MKIRSIYTHQAGPLGENWSIDLTDPASNSADPLVLLSGPNGSGKSFLLRLIAELWREIGLSLSFLKSFPSTSAKALNMRWLYRWGGICLLVEDVFDDVPVQIGLFHGIESWFDELSAKHPHVVWFGWTTMMKGSNTFDRIAIDPAHTHLFKKWGEAYQRLIVTSLESATPNIIYLDAEKRKWVPPTQDVGDLVQDDYKQRWLTSYEVTENWRGQLESGLINLKIYDEQQYRAVIADLNSFLVNKRIEPDIMTEGENRLRVTLNHDSSQWHYLDELSAGERQVLIMIYIISRWMEDGGVVLLDEPDLHLHPSLIQGLLGQVESMVQKRNGQLIITSHVPAVWERYRSIGRRVQLGAQPQVPAHDEIDESLQELEAWLEDQHEQLD